MKTIIKSTNVDNIDLSIISQAADILRRGGLVAFPTETVYGLGADGLNADAAQKIYAAKGRPSDNPLIVHVADIGKLDELAEEIPESAGKLVSVFWPGPLTIIFKKSKRVPSGTTGGLDTVAIRMPEHPIARELIRVSGVNIAAPSANISGKPSPTCGEHVIEDMDGKIDMIIDGGEVGMGLESTIVDVTCVPPMILRPGFITKEMLEEVVGEVASDVSVAGTPDINARPKAPGMKYRHYAPRADFVIFEGDQGRVADAIVKETVNKARDGIRVGVIATDENRADIEKRLYEIRDRVVVLPIGTVKDMSTIARNLYGVLRQFDRTDVEQIYGEAFLRDNIGQAVMNRLCKAAGYNIVKV